MIVALLIVAALILTTQCVQVAQNHLLMRKLDGQAIKVIVPAKHKERFPDSEDHMMVGRSQNPLII